MEIKIMCNNKECIKPCSSTPSHLKTFKMSLLDQFIPPLFFSTAFFYPNINHECDLKISQRSSLLKHSLSKTLSDFYPLAGKIKDYTSIDCNDEGAYYIEATANISMSEYLGQPDPTLLPKLVPDVSSLKQNPIGSFLVLIQVTTFACGGLVIGISVSHIVLDGTSFASFIKSWATLAASSSSLLDRQMMTYPDYNSRCLFPYYDGDIPKEALFTYIWSLFARKDKYALSRLMFDASGIDKLKAKVVSSSSSRVENPSRVEVVTSIIAKTMVPALNAKSGIEKAIAISLDVNLRRRATPPFPDSAIGNFIWPTQAIFTKKETELSNLVYQLRNIAIRKVNSEFVKNSTEAGGPSKLIQDMKDMVNSLSSDEMELMAVTSWCNFGLYNNSDFGWGKPIWIVPCIAINDSQEITRNNLICLFDTRSGDGIEAWCYLPRDIVAVIEKDDEILQYASINVSPLTITTDDQELTAK